VPRARIHARRHLSLELNMNEPGIADPERRVEARRRRPIISRGLVALALATIAAAALAITVLPTLITHQSVVPRLSVTNGSDYDVQVSVGTGRPSSWVTLGAAGQQCTTTFSQVADQGSDWVLRFQAQGVDAGTMTVSRAELEAAQWTVTIPADVSKQLADGHVPLPPHRDCGTAPGP
jgi:hypothetical protein